MDAQLQDSRFALGFAQTAHALGASVLTHARVDGVAEVDAAMRLVVRDLLRDRTCQLGAKLVVNAAGAWIDELRGARAKEKPLVEPSQGIHLVVDRIAEVPLIFSLPVDGRVFFVLPYGRDASLVGTTDTPIVGPPDAARPTRRDVNEILSYLFRFFPRLAEEKEYTTRHVRDVYWGLRPLLRHGGKAARASREHAVVRESAAWWSVPGVKLTAARAVGEEVALKAVEALRRERLPEIDLGSLPGGDIQDYDEFLEQSVNELVAAGLGADTASYLTRTYGTRATSVMERAKADAALARRVLPDEPWIYAQAAYAVDEEMVLTLNDLLWRRTKWAHYRQLPPDVIARLAQLLGERLAWAPAQRSSEIEAYDLEWSRHRFPIPG